jgi:hypothetical protein
VPQLHEFNGLRMAQRGFAATGRYVILGGADHRFSWSARKNDRRQKAIVCPTRNLRSAQRNEDLVAQAFLPVLDLIFSQFPVPGKIVEARICEVDQARSAFLPNNEKRHDPPDSGN